MTSSESEEDSEKMMIDEDEEELSESLSESSHEVSIDSSDEVVEMKTPKSSTPLKQKQELTLTNGSFLGRAVFTPDSTLPIGMKRSSQVMLYAVPYNPKIHKSMLASTPMSVKWSDATFEASPPKKSKPQPRVSKS